MSHSDGQTIANRMAAALAEVAPELVDVFTIYMPGDGTYYWEWIEYGDDGHPDPDGITDVAAATELLDRAFDLAVARG